MTGRRNRIYPRSTKIDRPDAWANVGEQVNGLNKAWQTKWRHSSGRTVPISTLRCKYCRVPCSCTTTTLLFAPFQLKQPTHPREYMYSSPALSFFLSLSLSPLLLNDNCDSSKYLAVLHWKGRIFRRLTPPFLSRFLRRTCNLLNAWGISRGKIWIWRRQNWILTTDSLVNIKCYTQKYRWRLNNSYNNW